MSFTIYIVGFAILIGGLIYAAVILHLAAHWIVVGSVVLLGLAIIPLGIWLSKKFSRRMSRSPFIQRLMKDLAGYNLNAATSFLAKLSEFEDETLAQ